MLSVPASSAPGASDAGAGHPMARYHLAAIVESADDAIVSKSLDGIIASWNRGAEKLFGYTEEEVVGKPVTILIPPHLQDEEPKILARLRRGEKIEHYETVRVRKDGCLVDISLTVSPIRADDGTIVGASKIARDISGAKLAREELRLALEEARLAREEAERANRLKDDFLSTISHELRTPLTAVMGWVSILRSGRLDATMVPKALETIERNVKAQAQLIEDLLDISRIVSGKIRLQRLPVSLHAVLNSAVDGILPAAESRGIRLLVMTDPSVGLVSGDADRLQQIAWNLLSNAVKFTEKGGRIEASIERRDSHVVMRIADTGRGIDASFVPHVFDRFSQEDSSGTRSHGGLGMGLAIVKYLTELHGGAVAAFSEGVGRGATFEVVLPALVKPGAGPVAAAGDELPWAGTGEVAAPRELEGMRILVVDDERDTCEMIGTALEHAGAVVDTAMSAAEALETLAGSRPDMLLCDINMPQVDGYELLRRLRSNPALADVAPVAVALTALARVEDRAKALAAGFQMHLPKPVELSELYAALASLSALTKAPGNGCA